MVGKIGKYQLLERLGRGAMSEVHKAKNKSNGAIVALKVLLPRDDLFVDLVGEERLRGLFFAEARIMAGLRHVHVAEIIETGEDDGLPYIALEYLPRSLGAIIGDSSRVERTPILAIDAACGYLLQILCCLDTLHRAGVVHRDIKPDNVMLTASGRIKLIDFGLCKIAGEDRVVIPGMRIGSPCYAAPEQEDEGAEADERSDLFSVGVIAYRLLTGRLVNHRLRNTDAPSMYNNQLTDTWDHFLLKGVNPERSRRFQSAGAMLKHLEEICRENESK